MEKKKNGEGKRRKYLFIGKYFVEGEENRRREIFFCRGEGKGGKNFGEGKDFLAEEWKTKRRKTRPRIRCVTHI